MGKTKKPERQGTKPAKPPRPSLSARLAEPPERAIEVPGRELKRATRRDFLVFGASAAVAAAGFYWLMPDDTRGLYLPDGVHHRLDTAAARLGLTQDRRERFLNRSLDFDDDVAEALYSKNRTVRTYSKRDLEPLRNNYNGLTPDPAYLADWSLTLTGLASGMAESLRIGDLMTQFPTHEQITRLVCVEGWSAVAGWAGFRFADLLRAYPPASGTKWIALESAVNLDGNGNEDPYYVSLDLATAMHPQTLLATHHNGASLPVEHGAPLRLIAPMKLGLKNIKAITDISYSAEEPDDYWAKRGYSKYDGL
ncbi:MAG: molybdopterin-dependent oxidoreductase [Acidobacteriota bacterium]